MQREVVIVAAKRTATGYFGGSLSKIPASKLGALAIQNVLADISHKGIIDEVIMGQALGGGCGQNPARQAAIFAELDITTPCHTISMACGSGMKALHQATTAIKLGEADVIVAGGQENMSAAPHIVPNIRGGKKLGNLALIDSLLYDGLNCLIADGIHMGITAENLAKKYSISRDEQDLYAFNSQKKAIAAQKKGTFKDEIFAVNLPKDKKFLDDEYIRYDVDLAKFSKLKSAFKSDGVVTAANSSGINDGASALVVMSLDKANELNLQPLVKIAGFACAGVDPYIMGIGPVASTKKCLKKIGWSVNDLDLIELNEAFAAQVIAVNKQLMWDSNKININGGAIALGHPIGASGARILVTLIHSMLKNRAKKGLATMCIGGGMGITTALELM